MTYGDYLPTPELRFYVDDGLKILQQKWVEHHSYVVQDGPHAPARVETKPTGVYQWRDVPLVEVKDESTE